MSFINEKEYYYLKDEDENEQKILSNSPSMESINFNTKRVLYLQPERRKKKFHKINVKSKPVPPYFSLHKMYYAYGIRIYTLKDTTNNK